MSRYNLWLQQGSYAASVDRRLFGSLWSGLATSQGLAVSPSSAMTLAVAPGAVAVPTNNGTGSCLCVSDQVENPVVTAAPASNSRIDLVVAQARGNDLDGGSNNDMVFAVIAGTVAASPTPPATPANAVALAQVTVASGTAAITAGMIADVRPHGLGREVALASGAPFSSYVDPLSGEAWVAKGGVKGGAWFKARDVLRARMYRTAGYTGSTSLTTVPYDTVDYDPYSMCTLGAAAKFTVPIAGLYLIYGIASTTGASAVMFGLFLTTGSGGQLNGTVSVPGANAPVGLPTTEALALVVNDTVTLGFITSAGMAMQTGMGATRASIAYMGTG